MSSATEASVSTTGTARAGFPPEVGSGWLREFREGRRADLWYVQPGDVRTSDLVACCETFLSEAERERCERMVHERDRQLQRVSRVLVRAALSLYLPIHPRQWRFGEGAFGKPFVAWPESGRSLSFSLSHCWGMVALLVAWRCPVGVDVEDSRSPRDLVRISRRWFSAREAREIASAPAEDRPERFRRIWTLKEAYLKARGLGLQRGLRDFEFEVWEDGRASVRFSRTWRDVPGRWQLGSRRLGPEHRLAFAIARHGRASVEVTLRSGLLLVGPTRAPTSRYP